MTFALLILGLLCSPAAHAQGSGGYPGGGSGSSGYPGSSGWVAQPVVVNGVTYPAAVSGTVESTFTDAYGKVTEGHGDYHNDGSSPPPLSVSAGQSLTYKVNGTVTYTWKWDGGPNNVPPPATQCVLETAGAGASGGGDVSGTVTVSGSDGGIGKENKVDSVSADGTTQSHSDGWGGSKLVTMDGSSGTLTVTGTVQAECDLSEPQSSGGYPGGGYPGGYPGSGGSGSLHGNAGCYFTAALDNRGLVINSFSTKHKNPTTGAADFDFPDPDGTFEMTSIYSHHIWIDGGDPPSTMDTPFINWIGFTPNFIGDWHWKDWTDPNGNTIAAPDVVDPDTWSWSPNESDDTWNYGKVSMGFGNIDYANGEVEGQLTGSQTYHVSYTATDNTDQASATANAKIALHDEWENKQNANPATTFNQQRLYFPSGTGRVAVRNDTQTKFTSPPTWTVALNASVAVGFKFSAGFEPGWAKVFGIEANTTATMGGSAGVSVPGPLLDPGYWTFPIVTRSWNTNNYLVDHYTVTGFDATYPQSADDPNSFVAGGSWTEPVLIGQNPP